jgi:hypothetical protein
MNKNKKTKKFTKIINLFFSLKCVEFGEISYKDDLLSNEKIYLSRRNDLSFGIKAKMLKT